MHLLSGKFTIDGDITALPEMTLPPLINGALSGWAATAISDFIDAKSHLVSRSSVIAKREPLISS